MNTQARTITCPKCDNGIMHIRPVLVGMDDLSPEERESYNVDMDCIYCEGEGKLTPKQKEDMDRQDAMWCRCPDYDPNAEVVMNGGGGIAYVLCTRCNGLLQTG